MNKFWTITDSDTTFTNSKSRKFYAFDDAVSAAKLRITNNTTSEVTILEAVAVVRPTRPTPPPMEVVSI